MKSLSSFSLNFILSVALFAFLGIYTFAALQLPVIAISGGEDHTLVLGANNQAFACGDNTAGGNTFGVLGTGSDAGDYELQLVRVHGPVVCAVTASFYVY